MKKILTYIKDGRGIAARYLLIFSLIISLGFTIIVHKRLYTFIPYVQETADQILPLKIEQGTVVQPLDTIKDITLFPQWNDFTFHLNIDTTADTLDEKYLQPGIYLTKKMIYTVQEGKITSIVLADSLYLPQADYRKELATFINYLSAGIFIVFLLFFFISALLLSLIYVSLSYLFTPLMKSKPLFLVRFRLSALNIIAVYGVVLFLRLFNINTNDWIIFGTLLILLIIGLNKIKIDTLKE